MGHKVNRNEALIYKKMLLENDPAKREELGKKLIEGLKGSLGTDFNTELDVASNTRTKLEAVPGFSKDAKTSINIRKKMASALTDDEFVNWIQSGGEEMPAVILSSEELELLKAGWKYQVVSVITVGIGCLITWAKGNCSW